MYTCSHHTHTRSSLSAIAHACSALNTVLAYAQNLNDDMAHNLRFATDARIKRRSSNASISHELSRESSKGMTPSKLTLTCPVSPRFSQRSVSASVRIPRHTLTDSYVFCQCDSHVLRELQFSKESCVYVCKYATYMHVTYVRYGVRTHYTCACT